MEWQVHRQRPPGSSLFNGSPLSLRMEDPKSTIAELADEVKWCDEQIQKKDLQLQQLSVALSQLLQVALTAAVNGGAPPSQTDALVSFAQRLWQQLGRAGVDLLPLSANISTTLEDGEQDIIARLQEKHQSEVHALHTELTAVRSADEALLTDLVKEVNSLTAELDTVRSTNANLAQQYEASKKEAALAWQCLAKRTDTSLMTIATFDGNHQDPLEKRTEEVAVEADIPDVEFEREIVQRLTTAHEAEVEKWQSTVAALNAQLASISLELQAQTAKASSLSSRCDELLLAAQEAHNDQRKTLVRLDNVSQDLQSMTIQLAQVKSDLHSSEAAKRDLHELSKAQSAQLTETTALATGLRAQIVDLDAELATVTAERSKFQHSTQDLDQQVSFYVAQLQSCQQSLADATAQHAMLQARVQLVSDDNERLSSEMQALKQKLVEVESALHQSEIDLLISRKLEAAASRARDAGVELVSVDTQTAEPESSKSPLALQRQIGILKASLEASAEDLKDSQLATETAKLQVQQSRKEIESLTLELSKVSRCVADQTSDNAQLTTENTDLKLKLSATSKALRSVEAESVRRKDAMDELAHQIQLMQRSLDNALSERDAHVADARASKDEMVTLHAQYEKACSEIRELKMKLAVVEQRWSTSERQGRSGREELEREQQRLKDANETIGTLRRSHEHLQAELSRAQDRITVLERDAEAHVGALDATKEQLGKVHVQLDEVTDEIFSLRSRLRESEDHQKSREDAFEEETNRMQTQMVELQLQSDRASAEASQLRDHLLKTQALLDQQKAHAEKWSAHSNAVGAEMQRMVLQHEERAEALFKAQETLQLHQTLLEDADERESALRIEVAEMKSQVLSYRREVESLKAQQKATSTSLYESSGRVQADLMAQLRDAERSNLALRDAEMQLRAELESLRQDLQDCRGQLEECESVRKEATELRVAVASMKGTQHRLSQQLEAVSAQLQASTSEKFELSRELEEMSDVLIRMESQLRQSRARQAQQ